MEKELRQYLARISVGASTVPRRKGLVSAMRCALAAIEIPELFPSTGIGAETYARALDRTTRSILQRPGVGMPWGVARKCVNIFARMCVYNRPLCEMHRHLPKYHRFLELPIDSVTADQLRRKAKRALPRFTTITNLQPADHRSFQQAASELAGEKPFPRVDLDVIWWGDLERSCESRQPTRRAPQPRTTRDAVGRPGSRRAPRARH